VSEGEGAGQPAGAAPKASDVVPHGGSFQIGDILRLIPHRYPFVLVDRCIDYVPMTSIVGLKCVSYNEPFFQGHFPADPVMPGVLIIEALAQTGAVMMSHSLNVDVERNIVFFAAVDKARFRSPVRPGDVLEMPVQAVAYRSNVFKFKGVARVGSRRVAEAEFSAMVIPRGK
jgi:3-hydroxyacyl-[acyl-carrier-protein] dehydratase